MNASESDDPCCEADGVDAERFGFEWGVTSLVVSFEIDYTHTYRAPRCDLRDKHRESSRYSWPALRHVPSTRHAIYSLTEQHGCTGPCP